MLLRMQIDIIEKRCSIILSTNLRGLLFIFINLSTGLANFKDDKIRVFKLQWKGPFTKSLDSQYA